LDIYNGSVHCTTDIFKKHGIKGLFRGYTSTLVRDIQGYAWFFYGYEATVAALAGPGKTKVS
jgi:hypothetical protein